MVINSPIELSLKIGGRHGQATFAIFMLLPTFIFAIRHAIDADLGALSAFLQESRVYLIPPKNAAGFRPALRKNGQDRRISVSKI
jgi:hypothetical protein